MRSRDQIWAWTIRPAAEPTERRRIALWLASLRVVRVLNQHKAKTETARLAALRRANEAPTGSARLECSGFDVVPGGSKSQPPTRIFAQGTLSCGGPHIGGDPATECAQCLPEAAVVLQPLGRFAEGEHTRKARSGDRLVFRQIVPPG